MQVDTLDTGSAPPGALAERARSVALAGHGRAAWVGAAAMAATVACVVRLWAVRGRHEYTLWPDEPAQLAIARFVGGGTHWTMRNHSTWRPGYGTLLAPVYAFTDDPERVYRLAMVLNSLLGGVAAALLVVLARRLTSFGPWSAGWAATAVAVTPALVFPAGLVWAESLIAPLYLGCVLALARFWEAPSLRRGVTVAVLCGACFVTHSRLLPLAVVAGGLIVVAVRQRRIPVGDGALSGAALVVALAAASSYSRLVTDRLWEHPTTRNTSSAVLDQFQHPTSIGVSAVGQLWYLVAGSLGVVLVGAIELARRARADRAVQVVALVMAVQIALAVVFMAERWRSDQLIYGRYNDVVVAPALVVGLAALAGRAGEWWTTRRLVGAFGAAAALVLGAGWAMWSWRSEVFAASNGLEGMILAIQPFADGRNSIPMIRLSVLVAVATGILALAVVAVRAVGGAWPVAALLAMLLTVGLVRTDAVFANGWNGSGGLAAVADLAEPGAPLATRMPADYYLAPNDDATGRLMLYQWYLPHSEITVVPHPLVEASSRYVFAPTDTPALRASGAEVVWHDPYLPLSLWDRHP